MRTRRAGLVAVFVGVAPLVWIGLAKDRSGTDAAHTDPVTARKPVLVELFTSEGCSSCPPADRLLTELVEQQPVPGAEVIALGLHVDYWNRLGWVDRFSSAEFTARQQAYAAAFRNDSVYTPQLIVDGQEEFVGSRRARALDAIAAAAQRQRADVVLAVSRVPGKEQEISVSVRVEGRSDLPGDTREMWLAITEEGLVSDVSRGENRGRRMAHAAVVRHLARIRSTTANPGVALTAESRVRLGGDWNRQRLRVVAFVQGRESKKVFGVGAQRLD